MPEIRSSGTYVEYHDCRDIIGIGHSLDSIKFPDFHMFDTNWKLNFCADCAGKLDTNVISLRLRHRRRSRDDIWNLEANIRVEVDEEWLKGDVNINAEFNRRQQAIQFSNFGVIDGKMKNSILEVHLKITMQVNRHEGIKLRNYIDFSRPHPIFSDAVVRISGDEEFHVNRMILSIASPVFLQSFMETVDEGRNCFELCNVSAPDFRRLLNIIYPPHIPPKQWIKEHDLQKQLGHIYRLLEISKALKIGTVFEHVDTWLVTHGRFELKDSILLAQKFGLRKLLGKKIEEIHSFKNLRKRRGLMELLNDKTKIVMLNHLV